MTFHKVSIIDSPRKEVKMKRRLTKQILFLMITVLLLASMAISVSANTIIEPEEKGSCSDPINDLESYYYELRDNSLFEPACKGSLKNKNGNEYIVDIYQSDEIVEGENLYRKDYVYKIGAGGMVKNNENAEVNSKGSPATFGWWDDSISVYGSVSLHYYSSGGTYLLYRVTGYWFKSDSSVSVSDRWLRCVCITPAVYYQNSSFAGLGMSWDCYTGYQTYISSSGTAALAAKSYATLSHGLYSVWSFETECSLFNTFGDIFT